MQVKSLFNVFSFFFFFNQSDLTFDGNVKKSLYTE